MKLCLTSKVAACRILSNAHGLVTLQGYVLTTTYLQKRELIARTMLQLHLISL